MAVPSEVYLAFIEYLCFFFSLSACILLKIDEKIPKPYMDEIFHVSQAQKYCNNIFFEWDPMITTLPGLYISSLLTGKPVSWLFGVATKTTCNIFWLRSINVAFAVGNVIVMRFLIKKIHSKEKDYQDAKGLVMAIALGLFPVLYFFTFLYYTDAGSTFWILLMYLLSLHNKHVLASASGFIAVLFRQTNIVWVVFIAGENVAEKVVSFIQPDKKEISAEMVQSPRFLTIAFKHVFKGIKSCSPGVKSLISECLKDLWSYAILVVIFIGFIFINGSIVLGAKEDHKVSLNFPQIFYFLSFVTVFSFPHFITIHKILDFFQFLIKKPILVIAFFALGFPVIWKFTLAHRYLLADNRHYTFYIWAKIFQRHEIVKFILLPCYLYAAWSVSIALQHKTGLWKIIYTLCLFVNLAPQLLLEFRYYIVPYLILRINMKLSTFFQLILEALIYILVNILTIYIFMEKPFYWQNDREKQRFMW